MPKLFYTPTSCGAASFISAFTAGVKLDTEVVDIRSGLTASGVQFSTINEKGNVPCIVLDDGTVLNENSATLQWIADQAPGTVAAPHNTSERYSIITMLSLIGSEVHPNVGGLFYPNLDAAVIAFKKAQAADAFAYLTWLLKEKEYLVGSKATIADYYLYIVLSWCQWVGIELADWPVLTAFYNRVKALPNVAAAHERMATSPTTTL